MPVFQSLLERGAIVPCSGSPVNSPLLPVRKKDNSWRFVIDLRRVNSAVQAVTPVVPSPTTILTAVPPDAAYFSVVDIRNAFFSLRVAEESQFWFAFTLRTTTGQSKQYCFSRAPQGFCSSPTWFSTALTECLENFHPPEGSKIVSFIDDILLSSVSVQTCKTDTVALLCFLADVGLKVSKAKLQLCKTRVKYVGHILGPGIRELDPSRVAAITQCPRPLTKRQVLGFLGLVGYCRAWIMDFSSTARPLQLCANACKSLTEKVVWSKDCEAAFVELKNVLASAPALGLPDYDKPFDLFVCERQGTAAGVLCQRHGGRHRPVAYVSRTLDAVARLPSRHVLTLCRCIL